ncbi:hypothetical protein K435DRAFT_853532 [Dendrothele bispora CBS 962.96]|uniref:JmjC domain-containing protein n=1 Tax=Dendrothele bispora (strain CBS 962.96) TaxID=1314807 RepID=A0A4S8MGQ5_DENBC|nr:hypothetical protein K435DRAFT_853532 [Dendrothele bispora CBS 962.96]
MINFSKLVDYYCDLKRKDAEPIHYAADMARQPEEDQEAWKKRLGLEQHYHSQVLSNSDWKSLKKKENETDKQFYNRIRQLKHRSSERLSLLTYATLCLSNNLIREKPSAVLPSPSYDRPKKRPRLESEHQPPISNSIPIRNIDFASKLKGIYMPEQSQDLVWQATCHTTVTTCAPTVIENGQNRLSDYQAYLEKIAKIGLTESSDADVVFFRPDNPNLINEIRFVTSQGRLAFVTDRTLDSYKPKTTDVQLLAAVLEENGISLNRKVETHSMLQKTLDVHITVSMDIQHFLERFEDQSDSLFILDVPTNPSAGIPQKYGFVHSFPQSPGKHSPESRSLDDLESSIANTRLIHDYPQTLDKSWGLIHQPGTFTQWHHDADGKLTLINCKTGAKIWSIFIPSRLLNADQVREIMVRFAEEKFILPQPHHGRVVNILLTEGDVLFQPPGVMHQVYTITPSYFQGSSFWTFETLHLTRFSRLIDVEHGDCTTNVDHQDHLILQCMVRLALALPHFTQGLVHYKRPLAALYDMLGNRYAYITKHLLRRIAEDLPPPTSSRRRKNIMGDPIQAARREVIAEMDQVQHIELGLQILEKALDQYEFFKGGAQDKKQICKRYLERTDRQWFGPGEAILLDLKVLEEVYPPRYHQGYFI